ncbi:hypothetical protein F4776DRAFT_632351 [Hypoxylon sp. NC0597]|nr:hypothetical protein F4776DRAFT_632351 [Hypoxylon sp. NC0597]
MRCYYVWPTLRSVHRLALPAFTTKTFYIGKVLVVLDDILRMRPLSTHYWTWMVVFVGLHINLGRGQPMRFQYSLSPNHRT